MKPLLTHAPLLAVALSLLCAASPSAALECSTPIERSPPAAPVYVVLYGYPHSPEDPDRSLKHVDEDLLLMADFFEALGPRRVIVHGEPEPGLVDRYGDTLREPSWRALKSTFDELAPALAEHERAPQVYFYISGHGVERGRNHRSTGVFFGRPEPGNDEDGFNGNIDSRLIAREVLAPLSAHANVHIIADTCMSFFLLAARDNGPRLVKRVVKVDDRDFVKPFAARFDRVGASLASPGLTYETSPVGGIFSHAVRTAAMGLADLNGDGLITYREFHYALIWLLANVDAAARPVVVSPGLDDQSTFIDWRGSPAARVCLPSSLGGTFVIDTPHGRAASLPLDPLRPSALWLAPGRGYTLQSNRQVVTFRAQDRTLGLDDFEIKEARSDLAGQIFTNPIRITEAPMIPALPIFEPSWYVGGAATGAAGRLNGGGVDEGWRPAALVSARLGREAHRLAVEAGWSQWTVTQDFDTDFGDSVLERSTHMLTLRLGYDHLVARHGYEFSLGAFFGSVQQLEDGGELIPEATARATTLLPLPILPTLAVRLDARLSVLAASNLTTLAQIGLGLDYEWSLD